MRPPLERGALTGISQEGARSPPGALRGTRAQSKLPRMNRDKVMRLPSREQRGVAPRGRARPFSSIEDALEDIRAGKMVVVCDAEDRENEGDLTIAGQFAGPEAINFMATHARGLICLALTAERCEQLGLAPMVGHNQSPYETAFTISIEAREGVDTGISVHDRARTIEVAIDPRAGAADLVSPGHMFPLRARPGGVLERTGQTEAAVDLARLAGLYPAGVICEIMNPDGTMARVPDLERYCAEHGLKMIAISDLIAYRRRTERFVERVAETTMPTSFGEFRAFGYSARSEGKEHIAMVKGDVRGLEDVLVRVHSECMTGDVFGSLRCDCGEQLKEAMHRIEAEGRGVILYLSQEGRGIGLLNKLRAYELQELGLDTVDANLELGLPADMRDYGIGAEILADLGVRSVRLLTNNPTKVTGLERHGIPVSEQVPIEHPAGEHNRDYLRAKARRLGHALRDPGVSLVAVAGHGSAGARAGLGKTA
jgi:3,4-dihydroxy 2-butanone 4-phosphate synthase / GTP cyclohydrolase II